MSSMLSPETILDKLSAHIANAPQGDALAPRNEGLVWWFQKFCDGVKRNVIYGHENRGHRDGRFNSVNSGQGGPTELSLPYGNEPASGAMGFFRTGVLEEGFLNSFLGGP